RTVLSQIGSDLIRHPKLGAGKTKGQRGEKGLTQVIALQRLRPLALQASAQLEQAQVLGQQLLKGETLLGWMAAFQKLLQIRILRRLVQKVQRLQQANASRFRGQ